MTTHELIQILTELKSVLRRDNDLVGLIETIAGNYTDAIKNLDALLKETNVSSIAAHVSSLKNYINQTVNVVKELSLGKVFLDITITKGQLVQSHNSLKASEGSGLGALLNELAHFETTFEEFIKGYQPTKTLELITSARVLRTSLKVTANLVDLMLEKLESHVELKENEESLSVLFTSTDEYRDVIVKLNSLNDLYSELCPLFGVSTSQYPLRIVKFETGSLWLYVIGNAAVIGFIIWLLKKGAGYIYRNFTTEGKILSIPKQVEAADTILEFSSKLEEAGVDTKANREELQKTLVTITKKLNSLVANQASVEINNAVISVGQAYEQKFLQDGRRLRLEDGTQNEPDVSEEKQTDSNSVQSDSTA